VSVAHDEDLDRLRAAAAGFVTEPYLVTVNAHHQPHCAVVTVNWDVPGEQLIVHAPSSWPGSEASGHRQVTLLYPPAEPGGYSLIVDGLAGPLGGPDGELLAVVPTRAVLHRRGEPPSPDSSCGSDCVPILTR
jgi:hypothetical protein